MPLPFERIPKQKLKYPKEDEIVEKHYPKYASHEHKKEKDEIKTS